MPIFPLTISNEHYLSEGLTFVSSLSLFILFELAFPNLFNYGKLFFREKLTSQKHVMRPTILFLLPGCHPSPSMPGSSSKSLLQAGSQPSHVALRLNHPFPLIALPNVSPQSSGCPASFPKGELLDESSNSLKSSKTRPVSSTFHSFQSSPGL